MNISKETTVKELIKVVGVDPYTFRMQGINLSGGQTNALEYCQTMFNFPTMFAVLNKFKEKNNLTTV